MELKHGNDNFVCFCIFVLIVPSGIETSLSGRSGLEEHVLIVPSGIETGIS